MDGVIRRFLDIRKLAGESDRTRTCLYPSAADRPQNATQRRMASRRLDLRASHGRLLRNIRRHADGLTVAYRIIAAAPLPPRVARFPVARRPRRFQRAGASIRSVGLMKVHL